MPPSITPTSPTVYSGSASRIPPLRPYLSRFLGSRAVVSNLARTNLKARHYDTMLGQLWLIVGPLMLAGVYLLLRLILQPAENVTEAKAIAAQIVMGVFVFQYASGIVVSGGGSVLNSKGLLLNTSLPRLVYPTVALAELTVDLLTSIVVLFVVRVALGQPFSAWMLMLPVVLVLLAAFSYGAALVAATAAVYFRDTVNLLTYVTRVWLFVTPVVYTVDEIPASVKPLMALNPLYPFFALLDWLFTGRPTPLSYLAWAAGWAVVSLIVGLLVFTSKERDFALRIY